MPRGYKADGTPNVPPSRKGVTVNKMPDENEGSALSLSASDKEEITSRAIGIAGEHAEPDVLKDIVAQLVDEKLAEAALRAPAKNQSSRVEFGSPQPRAAADQQAAKPAGNYEFVDSEGINASRKKAPVVTVSPDLWDNDDLYNRSTGPIPDGVDPLRMRPIKGKRDHWWFEADQPGDNPKQRGVYFMPQGWRPEMGNTPPMEFCNDTLQNGSVMRRLRIVGAGFDIQQPQGAAAD